MKMMKKIVIVVMGIMMLSLTLTPFKLFAQEMDLTAERAEGAGVEDEVIKDEDEIEEFDELRKPADTWPKGDYAIFIGTSIVGRGRAPVHLGPTGLWGFPAGQNIWVEEITPGSPADGKVLPGDVIYGANGKGFPADRGVDYYFAMAITESETKEVGGKLTLTIRREGKFIQVPIQLKVMGSYSPTTPWDCEKSKNIIAGAEEYMRKGLRPATGLPNNGQYMFGPWNDSVLFLLAAGNTEMQGLVRRYIRNTQKDLETWKAGEKRGFETEKGWAIPYIRMLFAEYYHRTGDPTVLPYLDEKFYKSDSDANSPQPEQKWSPPVGPTGYGLHANPQMVGCMAAILADEAGLKINKEKLFFDLKYLYVKRAEYGYVKYFGYAPMTIEQRQTEAPDEITPGNKSKGNFSTMNGKLGTAAALFNMVSGYEKAVDMCSIRCVYAYNYHGSHGGAWFGDFWTPFGAYHAGPEKFQSFMKNQQWWRELRRDHAGAMWEIGNAREKKDTLSTGFAIHWVMPRKKLRMFGAPRSMFGPAAPAYMKEALAAHRNRDYALAEQLTLKLQASGAVPATDKARVDHFLDSVQTLKKSVEYDLTFTEALLKKGNYALASVELPQLEMVVAPNDSRLKAIAKALASTQAKAQIAAANAPKEKDKHGAKGLGIGARRDAKKDDFSKQLESVVTLVKDGAKYEAHSGRVVIGTYPVYPKTEVNQWRLHAMEAITNAPAGWEQPGFDDSTWQKPKWRKGSQQWPEEPVLFMRTTFEVESLKVLKSLRVRVMIGKNDSRNFTLYMNGNVVAKATSIPRGASVFDLNPGSLALLKAGKNTLALSTQHGQSNNHGLSIRLEGILKDPSVSKPPDISKTPEPSKKKGKAK